MLVTIAHYHDPIEAHIARGLLASHDVDAHLDDEHLALANWEWRLAMGGVKLRVPEAQAQRAREILHAAESGEYALVDDTAASETQALQPPDRESPSSRLAWIGLMLFGIPLPWRRRKAPDQQARREM